MDLSCYPNQAPPPLLTQAEMDHLFHKCRSNDWNGILQQIHQSPQIATTAMRMDNRLTTTILHQAITSKGPTPIRAEVISLILRYQPLAAAVKNGNGSLPLHTIAQRNTKMDKHTKERLIFELVRAFPPALLEGGGMGRRTPLHILFTGMWGH